MSGTEATPEVALEHSSAGNLADVVAAMREPFVLLDAGERLLAWNPAYADLHRGKDGVCTLVPGMSYDEMAAWRARTGFYRTAMEARADGAGEAKPGSRRRGDLTCQLADGRWMLVERYPLPDGRNLGLWIDITALKRAEERLQETAGNLGRSEAQLLQAQRIAHLGSDACDFETGEVIWSHETHRIFGVDPASFVLLRENVLALIHPDDRAVIAEDFVKGGVELAPLRHEFRIIRPDGAERIIVRESEVVFDTKAKPLRRVGTIQDVTTARIRERLERDLQHALEATNEELERRVEARTRELQAAQDELLKKERLSTIGQLTAMVAHELRNPLSAIKNTLFSLKETPGAAPALGRAVARMERSVERCNQIIAELLEYSRTRALHCEERCFDAWLGDLLDEQTLPPPVQVVRDFRAGAARVAFDADRFRRVIINLVENAAQALIGAAGPEPRITLATRLAGDAIVIEIADNGPGIAPENAERIFEPLFSTKSAGTGLGLPMVRQIVEQHGGAIALQSVLGEGARFSVRIPLQRAAEAA